MINVFIIVERVDESRPYSMDRLGMQAGRGQGPVATVHRLLYIVYYWW